MVCCWKGMENLQCGSQNHHVCHIAWLKAYLQNVSNFLLRRNNMDHLTGFLTFYSL